MDTQDEKEALQERVKVLEKELAEAKANESMWLKSYTNSQGKLDALCNALKGITDLV